MAGVLHVIRDLDYGGAQTQLRLLAEAAHGRGDPVRVASLRRPGAVGERLREAGVAVEWLGRRWPIDPFVCRRLTRLLNGGVFGAVQSWDADAGRHVLLARRRAGAAVRWLHAVREPGTPDWAERRVRCAADRLVTPSKAIADELLRGGVSPERVAIVPNESAALADETPVREGVFRRLGLPASTRLIVSAMRLDESRLAKELVWAADLVRVVHPEVRLLLVGDGPARRRVERFARDASEAGLAVFGRGRDDWPELLAAADTVWCASDTPDAPTPLIEAMRAGKPVVANEAPGRERLIADGVSGWLTPWDHRAGWARATVRLLEDADLARRIGEAGRERVREAFAMGEGLTSYDRAASS